MEFSEEMLEFVKFAVDHHKEPDLMLSHFKDFISRCQKDEQKSSLLDFMVFLASSYNSFLRDVIKADQRAMIMLSMMFDSWEAARYRSKVYKSPFEEKNGMIKISLPSNLFRAALDTIMKIDNDAELFKKTEELLKERSNLPDDLIKKTVREFYDDIKLQKDGKT